MAKAPAPIPIPSSTPVPQLMAEKPKPVEIPPAQLNPPEVFLLGDPRQGGFRGLNTCGSNNDLAWGQSPNMHNYLVSNTGLAKRKGCAKDNAVEIGSGVGATGLHRHSDGTKYRTFIKIGARVYDLQATGQSDYVIEMAEAGDAADQLDNWVIEGANPGNTDAGVLYWKLTDTAGTRTVDLYKNSDGLEENKVASGSLAGDGTITLAAVNDSGLTGAVDVAYTADDTDLAANTLTFGTLDANAEIEFESWANRYFFVDGVSMYSGTAGLASAVAWLDEDGNPTADWELLPTPAALVLHKEHLWWFDKNSSRVGFTVRGHYDRIFEDTLNAGNYGSWVHCDAGDGQYLTALVRMPMADALMAFKREKSFFIEGDFDSVSNTLVVRSGFPSGAYSQKGVTVGPDGFVYWYGPDGIWQYRHDAGPICVSRNKDLQLDIDAVLQGIPFASRTKCCMGYDIARQYLLFFYPSASSTYNDLGLAYDTVKREWMPIRAWNVARVCEYEDGTIHAGWSNSGHVKKLFAGDNDDGAAISYYYETKYYGISGVEGILDSIRARITAGYFLKVKWESDPGTGINGEIEFAVDETPPAWGDRDHPGTIAGALHWGDRDNPGTIPNSAWDDRNARLTADFATRVDAGQRFREVKFIFEGSSVSPHALDFVEARYYQKRLVV